MKQKSNIKINKKIMKKQPAIELNDLLKIMNEINFEINNKDVSPLDNEDKNALVLNIEPQINLNYDKKENAKKVNKKLILSEFSKNNDNNKNTFGGELQNNLLNKQTVININNKFKNIVKTNNPISADDISIKPIVKDGNCFYRSISFFLLGDENYYMNVKELIINWIEANYLLFESFFSDDTVNNIGKKEVAKQEFEYIKANDSWGTYHTFEIACMIFNISIAVYTYNGTNLYNKYFLFENGNSDSELMIIHYITNFHFELIFDKNYNTNDSCITKDINKFDKIKTNQNIKFSGTEYNFKYIETNFNNNKNIYDDIYKFLKSIKHNQIEIDKLKKKYPKMQINQIYSKFNLYYPKCLNNNDKKKRKFRKLASKFILDNNGRLCIVNPINNKNNSSDIYKIPLANEKITLVKNFHYNNSHSGRNVTVQLLLDNKWYWHGINTDVLSIIKSCPGCANKNKFKKIFKNNKIIIEEGPHFRYIADLWELPNEIFEVSGFKFIIDVIDHFSKWYYGYLLPNKEAKNVLNKIEQYILSFGVPKILQCDNGGEFKNSLLENYCINNNIKLIFSSPYHPQTNGACESVHKEIRKHILSQYLNKHNNFNIEEELLAIIKIHNNKPHSTTKRIPQEIRDITDINEIEEIKNNIITTLSKKNKNIEYLNLKDYFVLEYDDIKITKNIITENYKNKKKKRKNILILKQKYLLK